MHATLLFVIKDGKILLIEKRRGIGAGKINGPGGKIDPGETARQGAIRETQEELLITPINPVKRGELWFAMSDIPDIHCHVYVANNYHGTPTLTAEAVPRWTAIEDVPYEKMWADDEFWLPQVIDGQCFIGKFVFDGETIIAQDVSFQGVESDWRNDGEEVFSG